MVGDAYLSDWVTYTHVLMLAAILGVIAAIILAAPALSGYLRRRRESRQMYTILHPSKESSTPPAIAARAERIARTENVEQDALGWSAAEAVNGPDDSQNGSGVEPGAVLGREKTILVADDDSVVVHALSRRLQQMGFTIFRSPDAAHALLGAMKLRPDLVILDINMPSGNGLAVCEMMASDPQYAGIPVIIHSAFADEATKQRCQQLGAHHVEKSPRSWAKIKSLVETLIGENKTASPRASSDGTSADKVAVEAPHPESPRRPSQAGPPTIIKRPELKKPAPAPAPAPSGAAAVPISPVCGRSRVLCIESPKDRLEPVEHQLSALGMDVTRMSGLEEGFWTCFTEKPHVVIVQVAEAGKRLFQLLERLRQHPVTRAMPVLLINENNAVANNELIATAHLKVLKHPLDWEELLTELEALVPGFGRSEGDPLAGIAEPRAEAGRVEGPTASAGSPSSEAGGEQKPLKVLCIDDDPVVARSIALRLQPYGIKVKSATNGTQGYLMAVTERPDLILLDLKMPNGEGNYVLSKLKSNDQLKDIPVIILTVETHPGVRRQMLASGAAAFLSKPVRWPELFAEMSRCIQLPQQLMVDYKLLQGLTLAQL